MPRKSNGGKADNLMILRDAGFNVPIFYVVQAMSPKTLQKQSIRRALLNEYAKWSESNDIESVAVRSSSLLEDGEQKSFAGQFTSVVDVRTPDDFFTALSKVLTSEHSTAYSRQKGAVHAVVQKFIEPDVSGVMFSINPANGSNEFVINAAEGRADQVVDGLSAEQYFIDRRYTDRVAHAGKKKNMVNADHMRELIGAMRRIETLFGSAQDVEWAIKDDELYILQARPITNINHLKVWDSSNISESYPGIISPLTFSIAKRGYQLSYKAQAHAGGLSWHQIEANHHTFDSMVGIFNGKMYYNLNSWYEIMSLFPGATRNQQFLDDQIETKGRSVYKRPANFSTVFKISYMLKVLYRIAFFNKEINGFYKEFESFEARHKRYVNHDDTQLLMEQYTHIEHTIIPHFGRTLDNDFLVMTYNGLLKRCLSRWLNDNSYAQSDIIGSISGVLSADQATMLYRIAEAFKIDEAALGLLGKKKYKALDTYLANTELGIAINDYLDLFGHRFAEDQKIEAKNPVLEPGGIYELIHPYTQLDGHDVNKRLASNSRHSKDIYETLFKDLNPYQKVIIAFLTHNLKKHLRLREKNRLLRGKVFSYLRDLFPKIGESLRTQGVISRADDVFYLQIDELYQIIQGAVLVDDIKSRISARKKAYEHYNTLDMPERFITTKLAGLEKPEPHLTGSVRNAAASKLSGLVSSPGMVQGRVVVLKEPSIPKEPFDILVAKHTDPGWTPIIALAKGVIVEYGGMLSHAAIITRELGIPSMISVLDVTKILKTGMVVRMNPHTAEIEILDRPK